MPFVRTPAIDKILSLTKRIKIIQGGTWGGKTYGIIPVLINESTYNSKEVTTIVAETIPALKDGPIRIFKEVMQETGRWVNDRWNGQDNAYTFANGSTMQFKSFDSVGKAKASGKRHRLFVNEANHNSFEIIDALMMRTEKEIYLDYNPDGEFWVQTELLNRDDVDFLVLNYKDNPCVPETILHELNIKMQKGFYDPNKDWDDEDNIKSKYWANWCRVYIKGETGSLEGVILKNWELIRGVPVEARIIGRGLDFGYTNDPTSIVELYKYNEKVVLHEVCYRSGLVNSEIAKLLSNDVTTYADSAEPKSIEEIKICGVWNIEGAKKGPDSILYGLQLMQDKEFLVTENSTNLIKELRGYCWDKDKKTGQMINKPSGTDHAIDAVRYAVSMLFSVPESWSQIWA